MFIYEKERYYYLGALKFPVRITQEFWDEMWAIKKSYQHQQGRFVRVDTTFGTNDDSFVEIIGDRPVVPTWIKDLRMYIVFFISLIVTLFMILKFITS